MGSKGRIPPSHHHHHQHHHQHHRRGGPPDPYGPSHHHPSSRGGGGPYPPYDMLPPPQVLEQKLASQHVEMQRLATENQRLASTHGTLRQELAGAQHELQVLHAQAAGMKAEREQQMRAIADKIAKMELDLKSGEPVKKELQQARAEAQGLVVARQEGVAKVQQLSQELQRAHCEAQQLHVLVSQLEGLRQEYQHCRATFDYEKKLYNDHLESLQVMEKNYVTMAREVEKLRAELLNNSGADRRTGRFYYDVLPRIMGIQELMKMRLLGMLQDKMFMKKATVSPRDVPPSLLLLLLAVLVGLEAVLLLVLALAVLLLLPLLELLHLQELNLDLLEGLVMRHKEGPSVMIPLEDLLMMHKDLVMICKEESFMMHKDRLMIRKEPPMMHKDQAMMCKEDQLMIHPGVLTMMHSPLVLRFLRDMCLQPICPMVQPHCLQLEVEMGTRHNQLEELQTPPFVDEAPFIVVQMAAYDPIDGMESVVATVSRYDGTERANLIKLISHAGANYVGTLSRANAFTHLVCQKFKGKKYQLAKKLNLKIVNHRWIEECLKQRRRVPEHLYTLRSGQQVGPLRMQVPIAALGGFPAKAWWKWVCERTQFLDEFERIIHPPRGGACPRREVLTDSVMSDEDSFPEFKEKNICQKPENESVQRNLKKELQSSSMHRFQDSLPSTSFRMEDFSTHSYRAKSNILSGTGSCMAETSRKRRKLMEKDIDNAGLVLSDSDQEFQPVKYHHIRKEKVTVLSDDSDDDLDMQDVGEVGAHVSTSKDPKSLFVDTPTALQGSRQVNCLEKEPATPSSSTACVICLIGFSSIRGILSCGHRFCFHCIKEWADHMISRRKMPACPLCKHTFTEITRVDQAATSDQNVFSQTIPSASKVDVSFLTDQGISNFAPQTSPSNTCGVCGEREIEELLISCDLCQNRHIHTYCHDPALTSNIWTCLHCKDLRMLLCRYPRY